MQGAEKNEKKSPCIIDTRSGVSCFREHGIFGCSKRVQSYRCSYKMSLVVPVTRSLLFVHRALRESHFALYRPFDTSRG